jgi:hypothetical protein
LKKIHVRRKREINHGERNFIHRYMKSSEISSRLNGVIKLERASCHDSRTKRPACTWNPEEMR